VSIPFLTVSDDRVSPIALAVALACPNKRSLIRLKNVNIIASFTCYNSNIEINFFFRQNKYKPNSSLQVPVFFKVIF